MCDRVIEQAVAKLEEAGYKRSSVKVIGPSRVPPDSEIPRLYVERRTNRCHKSARDNRGVEPQDGQAVIPRGRVGRLAHPWSGRPLHSHSQDGGNRNRWSTAPRGGRRTGPQGAVRHFSPEFYLPAVPLISLSFACVRTGLPLSTYFSAIKLRWMIDNWEDVRKAHEADDLAFGTIESWIAYVSPLESHSLPRARATDWVKDRIYLVA